MQAAGKVLDEGTPELIAAVEQGDIAVSAAAEIAALPQEEQPKAMAHVGRNTGENEWYTPPQALSGRTATTWFICPGTLTTCPTNGVVMGWVQGWVIRRINLIKYCIYSII